ncbi:MAG: DUF2095 family protein [Candidatus Helarchaeota archaeon]
MPQKKRKTSKKRKVSSKKSMSTDEKLPTSITGDIDPENISNSQRPESCIYNQYDNNISLYEKENMDLLETINGIEYDFDEFKRKYPHLAEELTDPNLLYPIDAVRWEDEECLPKEEFSRPEEPTVESLLRRSRTEEEALEIITFLEKRGEISSQKAKRLISTLKSKGLKAFQSKRKKKK